MHISALQETVPSIQGLNTLLNRNILQKNIKAIVQVVILEELEAHCEKHKSLTV